MIPILAWRNIWRSTTRSLVVIGAIALGIWAALAMTGFATGMVNSYVKNAVTNIVSHVQIHHPKFEDNYDLRYYLPQAADKANLIRQVEEVRHLSVRSLVSGMLASGQGARGVRAKGIVPEDEARVSGLDGNIVEGGYFENGKKNALLIGRPLAEKLHVKLRSKVVLTFTDLGQELTSAAFRITGIFDTGNSPFDEGHVFVRRQDLNRLMAPSSGNMAILSGRGGGSSMQVTDINQLAHEIAIMLEDSQQAPAVADELGGAFPDLKVETYREVAPELQLYESQIHSISIVYLVIIMLALVFGIVNTMLMAVLERFRELGMLMAIGMSKGRVFAMIVLETIMLSIVGAPLGTLAGWLTTYYLGNYGLDLSAFADTLKMYGMSEIVYFEVPPVVYGQIAVAVAVTAIIASIYPAFKAIRLRPVEAIRKI